MNKKLFKLGAISPILTLPILLSASCGSEYKSNERIKQEEFLANQKRLADLESIYKKVVLSIVYNLNKDNKNLSEKEISDKFQKEFENKESMLYKDSYNAFQFYAKEKLASDPFYFVNKFNDWNKQSLFTKTIDWLKEKEVPGEEEFIAIWKTPRTEIQREINNILLVKNYFAISKLEDIKKIVKGANKRDFKYYAGHDDAHYALDHYFLNKYAISKKYIQQWDRPFDAQKDKNYIFTQGKIINDINTFNSFFDKLSQKDNKIEQWQLLTDDKNSEVEKQLSGYVGFVKDPGKYKLDWEIADMKKKTDTVGLFGVFNPLNKQLISFQSLKDKNSVISPVQSENGSKINITVSYINQIVPIGGGEKDKIEVPKNSSAYEKKFENLKEDEKEKISVLSFKNTIFKDHLDRLSYLFYLKDSSLLNTAIEAYAHLGIKVKINKDIKPLYDLLKDKVWVEK